MHESELDPRSICRGCACPLNGKELNLLKVPETLTMFQAFSGTQVKPDDSLPKSICSKCNIRLEDCKRFQNVCIASYKFLLECFPPELNDKFNNKKDETKNVPAQENDQEENSSDTLDDESEDSEYYPHEIRNVKVNRKTECKKFKMSNEEYLKETLDSDDDKILAEIVRECKEEIAEERRKDEERTKRRRKWMQGKLETCNDVVENGKQNFHENSSRGSLETLKESIQDSKEIKQNCSDSKANAESESSAEDADIVVSKEDSNYNDSSSEDENRDHWKCVEDYNQNKKVSTKVDNKEDDDPMLKLIRIETYACDQCPKTFLMKERYEGHLRQHAGLKPFECDKCHKKYARFERLKSHKLYEHSGKQQQRYCCEIGGCDKTFKNRETLQKHIKAHSNPPKPTYQKSERRVFICELCGKQLHSKSTLTEHEMMHKGESPYTCDLCPKSFRAERKLQQHKLRHEGVKKFTCEICGLKKITKKELKSHMNIHTREKQFPCKACDAIFLAHGNLVRHVQVVHTGLKLHRCTYCEKVFAKAQTLRMHTMKHTGEKPLMCPHCDKRCISRPGLQYHIRRHQQDSTKTTTTLNENEKTCTKTEPVPVS